MFTVYLLAILSVEVVKTEFLASGDNCYLPSGRHGTCTPLPQCTPILKDFQQGNRSQPCGFQGSIPLVCCPNTTDETTKSKSVEKCNQYKDDSRKPLIPFGSDVQSAIGGFPAVQEEFPHMVALGFGNKSDIHWLCGGSLISEKFVLTAAHCLTSPDYGLVRWVQAGTVNLQDPSKGGYPQEFEVANRYRHPDFKRPSRYNDIALLELNSDVFFTSHVRPACINTNIETEQDLQAAGWGLTEYAGLPSNDLIKVNLTVYRHDTCKEVYSNTQKRFLERGIVYESQICAGGAPNEIKDTCQGDSGGPLHELLVDELFKLYNVIGVVSFGKGCGTPNIPGVYTRVAHFVPWIESIVWPS